MVLTFNVPNLGYSLSNKESLIIISIWLQALCSGQGYWSITTATPTAIQKNQFKCYLLMMYGKYSQGGVSC